jgi:hypothetical protein
MVSVPPGAGSDDDLSRYRYHTGAALRPVAPGEEPALLFRDLGPVALALYLRGQLRRLAGPYTPLLYMRDLDYREPFVDHADIGRLVLLRVGEMGAWHAGLPGVYVARASRPVAADAVGYAPPGTTLADVARLAAGARDAGALREALGGRLHDEARAGALARLDRLNAELAETEVFAEPLRRAYQASDPERRAAARAELARLGIAEIDLCAAWHHLPADRRELMRAVLSGADLARLGGRR